MLCCRLTSCTSLSLSLCHLITPWLFYNFQLKPQRSVDNEDFRKVFDRPYAAPLPSESAPQNTQVQTSHYDYNFDEKDYKSELEGFH